MQQNRVDVPLVATLSMSVTLPLDWYLDEVLLLAMPKKKGWEGLADGPRTMEVVVSR